LSASWLRHDVRHAANFTSWSLGPLAVNVPLVGRDALNARADAATASYEAAQVAYNATLRRAVSEVEQALVAQNALQLRRQQAAATLDAMRQADQAAQQSLRAGLSSGNAAQDARRQWLGAQSAAVALQLEQLNAAVALYVALGGGFDAAQAQDLNRNLP
jgi:outer membrane protein TolC